MVFRTLKPGSAPGLLLVDLQSRNRCSHLLQAAKKLTAQRARTEWRGTACALYRSFALEFKA